MCSNSVQIDSGLQSAITYNEHVGPYTTSSIGTVHARGARLAAPSFCEQSQ